MKTKFLTLALCFFSVHAFAIYQVGEKVRDMSWTDVNNQEVHLLSHDIQGNVRVLLYNAGWCGPCNSEMEELVPLVSQFDGKSVTFISLSAEGWRRGAEPNQQFLKQWKQRHGIPFVVAGSPDDFGGEFTDEHYIPFVAIIDGNGKFAYGAVSPGASAIVSEVQKLLSTH